MRSGAGARPETSVAHCEVSNLRVYLELFRDSTGNTGAEISLV